MIEVSPYMLGYATNDAVTLRQIAHLQPALRAAVVELKGLTVGEEVLDVRVFRAHGLSYCHQAVALKQSTVCHLVEPLDAFGSRVDQDRDVEVDPEKRAKCDVLHATGRRDRDPLVQRRPSVIAKVVAKRADVR